MKPRRGQYDRCVTPWVAAAGLVNPAGGATAPPIRGNGEFQRWKQKGRARHGPGRELGAPCSLNDARVKFDMAMPPLRLFRVELEHHVILARE